VPQYRPSGFAEAVAADAPASFHRASEVPDPFRGRQFQAPSEQSTFQGIGLPNDPIEAVGENNAGSQSTEAAGKLSRQTNGLEKSIGTDHSGASGAVVPQASRSRRYHAASAARRALGRLGRTGDCCRGSPADDESGQARGARSAPQVGGNGGLKRPPTGSYSAQSLLIWFLSCRQKLRGHDNDSAPRRLSF
jgi:hypothetical protein